LDLVNLEQAGLKPGLSIENSCFSSTKEPGLLDGAALLNGGTGLQPGPERRTRVRVWCGVISAQIVSRTRVRYRTGWPSLVAGRNFHIFAADTSMRSW